MRAIFVSNAATHANYHATHMREHMRNTYVKVFATKNCSHVHITAKNVATNALIWQAVARPNAKRLWKKLCQTAVIQSRYNAAKSLLARTALSSAVNS